MSAVLSIAGPVFGADLAGAVYDQTGAANINAALELRLNTSSKVVAQTKTNTLGL